MKHSKHVVFLISAMFLALLASACSAAEYIEPTFTENINGPTIGTTVKQVISQDGKYYRDSNGNGSLDIFENWELSVDVRVNDLVSRMTSTDKLGLLTIGDRGSGYTMSQASRDQYGAIDGILNDFAGEETSRFGGSTTVYATTTVIKDFGMRRFIFRENITPSQIATWNNALQQVAESTSLSIPVVIASNSRNENGQEAFGMNDASGIFSTWPGTLGLAAAALGDIKAGGDAQLITDFAEISRAEWDASGIKKGYMYMADVVTDPRWQRTYGTLGERPDFVADAIGRLIRGFQGSADGVQTNGVALTTKHFPGGGARENGFDPHYSLGQYNVYATENSLEKYHLPSFKAAIENNTSSIMPYYARPKTSKIKLPQNYENQAIDLSEEVGFAYNKAIITALLRDRMGFKGYINSDTGILGNMAWGMTQYSDNPGLQAAYAINAGTDVISGLTNIDALKTAYERASSADFLASDTNASHVLSDDRLNEAAGRLLKEEFELGLFENPYRNPASADAAVATARADERVYLAHQKSVVLLKNKDKTLPLSADKLSDKSVYVEFFNQTGDTSDITSALKTSLTERGMTVTDDYTAADYAILFLNPASGQYFSATAGYLEIDICDSKDVVDVDAETGVPLTTMHKETTLTSADKVATIAEAVHANGGKVIANVNITLAWLMGNVEPYVDALTVGFDTFTDATLDVMTGEYNPTGVLPLTLPRNDAVISVDQDANCVSPNDVPGYDKNQYLPDNLKEANGNGYAYLDSEGNYYESLFGLAYASESGPGGSSSGGGTSQQSGLTTPEAQSKVREALGVDSSVSVIEVTESMRGGSNTVAGLTDTQKSKISSSHEAKLALETMTFTTPAIYTFGISRSELLGSGLKVGDKLFLYMLEVATNSVSSAASTGDYKFFNSNGDVITEVPATGDVDVAVYADAGSYVPVIASEKSSSGSLGDSGGGCDTGLSVAGVLLICGLFAKFRKAR